MPKMRSLLIKPGESKRIVRIVKQVLLFLIILLIAAALILIFKIGGGFWPIWMIEHRAQIMGITLLALFFLILWYPIMVEVTGNPRTLYGPGKNPENPWDNLN